MPRERLLLWRKGQPYLPAGGGRLIHAAGRLATQRRRGACRQHAQHLKCDVVLTRLRDPAEATHCAQRYDAHVGDLGRPAVRREGIGREAKPAPNGLHVSLRSAFCCGGRRKRALGGEQPALVPVHELRPAADGRALALRRRVPRASSVISRLHSGGLTWLHSRVCALPRAAAGCANDGTCRHTAIVLTRGRLRRTQLPCQARRPLTRRCPRTHLRSTTLVAVARAIAVVAAAAAIPAAPTTTPTLLHLASGSLRLRAYKVSTRHAAQVSVVRWFD